MGQLLSNAHHLFHRNPFHTSRSHARLQSDYLCNRDHGLGYLSCHNPYLDLYYPSCHSHHGDMMGEVAVVVEDSHHNHMDLEGAVLHQNNYPR